MKLYLWLSVLWAQSVLPLSRLVYYSSGKAYWVREAVVPILRSPITVRIPGCAVPTTILPQTEYKVQRWFFLPDTIWRDGGSSPESLEDFLRWHVGSMAWVSYSVGNEWEEIQGTIEKVSARGDVLLRRPSQERVWMPKKVLRAARIEPTASFKRPVPGWRIIVEIDTNLPAGRVAVAGWDSLSPWRAVHKLRLISPTRALLTTQIELPPFSEDAPQIELFLVQNENDSTRSFTWHLPMQKLIAFAENRFFLIHAEMPYTDVYRASLPDLVERLDPLTLGSWRGYAERSLQLLNTGQIAIPSGTVEIFDEQGLPLAQSQISLTAPAATGYVALSNMAGIELRLQEQETRREKVKDPNAGPRVVIAGTLRIQNSTAREARLVIQKPITGQPVIDKLGFARATPLPERRGPNPRFLLQWELLLRPGASETLEYSYDLLLPAPTK